MPKNDQSSLCLDLEKALQIYPSLWQTASNQKQILRQYLAEDYSFRHDFTSLFPAPVPLSSGPFADDPIQKSLILLYHLAHNDELGDRITAQLEIKTDRATQACVMLDLLLKGRLPQRGDQDD